MWYKERSSVTSKGGESGTLISVPLYSFVKICDRMVPIRLQLQQKKEALVAAKAAVELQTIKIEEDKLIGWPQQQYRWQKLQKWLNAEELLTDYQLQD